MGLERKLYVEVLDSYLYYKKKPGNYIDHYLIDSSVSGFRYDTGYGGDNFSILGDMNGKFHSEDTAKYIIDLGDGNYEIQDWEGMVSLTKDLDGVGQRTNILGDPYVKIDFLRVYKARFHKLQCKREIRELSLSDVSLSEVGSSLDIESYIKLLEDYDIPGLYYEDHFRR